MTKLYDVIIPGKNAKDIETYDELFLVMEYVEYDLKKMMKSMNDDFNEEHMINIFYNLLCSLNFLHSANVIHRDL